MKNYLISIIVLFALSACATLPPLQEMSNARQTIAAAKGMNSNAEQSEKILEAERLLEVGARAHFRSKTWSHCFQMKMKKEDRRFQAGKELVMMAVTIRQ